MDTTYESQSARDASRAYEARYCEYLDEAAKRYRDYFTARGMHELAAEMMTRTLGQALVGNDGD